MDNLTHSLVGALIGQAGLKRKTGLAMPALIIGANLPDIDATCVLLGDMQHLALRRGITHGPIAWLLLPLALAAILYGWDRWQAKRGKRPEKRLPVHFGWLFALSLIGCMTHPALDWLNSYGIRLLEPFSHQWFYGDILFIIDIWLWLGLGFATWFSLRREKRGGEWRRPARIAIAAMLAYIGTNAAITHVQESRHASLGATVIASPPPLLSFNREIIAGGEGRYVIGGQQAGDFDLTKQDFARIAAAVPEARAFLFWSRMPLVERSDGQYLLKDARFYDAASVGRFTVVLPAQAFRESTSR